jgi:hypothetical protein
MAQDELLLTPKELARRWRQAPETIRRKVASGDVPAIRLGSGPRAPIRIPVDKVERQMTARPRHGGPGEEAER